MVRWVSFQGIKVVGEFSACMQGWRRKQEASDETGSWEENQACRRRDYHLHLEFTFNDLEGDCYLTQAYISLDMESMFQYWRWLWHQMGVVSYVSGKFWSNLLLLMSSFLFSIIYGRKWEFWLSILLLMSSYLFAEIYGRLWGGKGIYGGLGGTLRSWGMKLEIATLKSHGLGYKSGWGSHESMWRSGSLQN